MTYEPYQNVELTPSGQKVALEVLRHHRLLELYLHDKLNLPWDQVHAEAERLEHVLSETLEDAMAAALGNPTVDPHGDPIPTKDGHVDDVGGILLSEGELNRVVPHYPRAGAGFGSPGLPGDDGPISECQCHTA